MRSNTPISSRISHLSYRTADHRRAFEIFHNSLVRLVMNRKEQKATLNSKQNESFRKEFYDLEAAIIYAMHKETSEHRATFF